MSVTTTTTTDAEGKTTIQKVEDDYKQYMTAFHSHLTTWISHLKGLTAASTFATGAYALYTLAKHFV